jgi:polysaccharide biosynthesis PFTS motif protein
MGSVDGNNDARGVVVYLRITLYSVPMVILYLLLGYRILYLDIDAVPERVFQLEYWQRTSRMRPITRDDLDFYEGVGLLNHALDEIESGYDTIPRIHPVIETLAAHFPGPEVHLPFKKILADEVYRALYAAWVGQSILRHVPPGVQVLLVPEEYPFGISRFSLHREAWDYLEGGAIPRWVFIICTLSHAWRRIFWILIAFLFPFWILVQMGVPRLKNRSPEHFRVGFRVYRDDLAFHYRYRSIDFLVDGKGLTAGNTLFCAEDDIGDDYRQALAARGYRVVDLRRMLHHPTLTFLVQTVGKKWVPLWAGICAGSFREPPYIVRTALELLYKFLAWESYAEHFSIRHYVVYNDNLPGNVMRTRVLARHGVASWYYVHSAHSYDVFSPEGQRMFREIEFSYLHYTAIVVWGDKMRRYYQMCPNSISDYEPLGCLWSEHVREAQSEDLKNSLRVIAETKIRGTTGRLPRKIIGVFDTSFGRRAPLSPADMVTFFHMLFRLLDDLPDIGIIFKNKIPLCVIEQTHPELLPHYLQIRDHPRCYLCDPSQKDPAPVIAASDLVISLSFTSTTIEALGARKRALYLDPKGSYRGTYYDRYPRLVAHDYPELSSFISYWLSCTDEEFGTFLSDCVKGELDSFADGKAITRFRAKLCED